MVKGTGWYRPKNNGKINKNNNGKRGERVGEDGWEGENRKRKTRETRTKWWQWLVVTALVWAAVGLMGYAVWYGMLGREGAHLGGRQNTWPVLSGSRGGQQGEGYTEGLSGAGQVGRQQSTWGETLAQDEVDRREGRREMHGRIRREGRVQEHSCRFTKEVITSSL